MPEGILKLKTRGLSLQQEDKKKGGTGIIRVNKYCSSFTNFLF
jgi:hypothetical protein